MSAINSVRVVLYLNQFFAGIGGEEKADLAPQVHPARPGVAAGLQKELGNAGVIVATVFCGDNYVAEKGEAAAIEITELIAPFNPDVVIAGPAFGAGRYGLACGLVCVAVKTRLGIPAVTGMAEENPAVDLYRTNMLIVPTYRTAVGMAAALPKLASLALKLAQGETLAPPEVDGYLPRGFRQNEFTDQRGSLRAIDMLLHKLRGEPFITEWPVPRYDPVAPPAPLAQTSGLRVAMITTSGLVPKGNPDRLPSAWATKWLKYDLGSISDLTPDAFETIHGGYDTTLANADPDRIVPIDALRALEREGRIALHPQLYTTTGNMGSITEMKRIGSEIAADLYSAGIDAVIVGAT